MGIIKVGIDIHGVIDQDPNLFAAFSKMLTENGHQVHILTGREVNDYIIDRLRDFNISYNQIFSITSYHKKIGTYIAYKNGDRTQPLIDSYKWDSSKAIYCASEKLHFHIDDSVVYEKYFINTCTRYLRYTPELREVILTLLNGGKFAYA